MFNVEPLVLNLCSKRHSDLEHYSYLYINMRLFAVILRILSPVCTGELNIFQDNQEAIAKDAYLAVVNLTAEQETCSKILSFTTEPDFLTFLLEYILKPNSVFADIACQILSNISRFEGCAAKLIRKIIDNKETVGFDRMIQVFCRENYNKNAKLHYLGPLLSNLTQIKEARLALLDKKHYVIQRLLPYTEYTDSLVRRGGIVGALKNCCFETGTVMLYVTPSVKSLNQYSFQI